MLSRNDSKGTACPKKAVIYTNSMTVGSGFCASEEMDMTLILTNFITINSASACPKKAVLYTQD